MKKLLSIIDYQNDFVCDALGFAGAEKLDAPIAHLAQAYLAQGDAVLFTLDTHTDYYLSTREGRALPIPHCIKETSGWRIYGKTQQLLCETCATGQIFQIEKPTFGMPPAALLQLAQRLGKVDEILVTGLVTNMCVISNAVMLQAQWPEAQITIDAALCASFDPILHEKALDVMAGMQMKIINR